MFKFVSRHILFVFLLGPACLAAQNKGDSLSPGYTDTVGESNNDSLYNGRIS